MFKRIAYPLIIACLMLMSQTACNLTANTNTAASLLESTATPVYPTATIVPTMYIVTLTPLPSTNTPVATATIAPTAADGDTPDAPPVDDGSGERPAEGQQDGGGQGGQGGGGQMPDFATAAATLGVTEEALMEAMGEPGQQPDFAAAAAALGVTEEALMEALGTSGDMQGGQPPAGGPGGAPPAN